MTLDELLRSGRLERVSADEKAAVKSLDEARAHPKGKDRRDILLGGTGDDKLIGGKGADQLNGGAGTDKCLGGKGKDQLIAWE